MYGNSTAVAVVVKTTVSVLSLISPVPQSVTTNA